MRLRVLSAGCAIASATALMWSDTAIKWWSKIIDALLLVNRQATMTVMDSRPTGDADLHAVIWGTCAFLIVVACSTHRRRAVGLSLLATWTIFVEFAQPWFTEQRTRQASDLIGNIIGIGIVGVVIQVVQMRKQRRLT